MALPLAPDRLANLLYGNSSETRPMVERAASGLALSATFGAAAAARHGVLAMLVHAAGVPLGLTVAVLLATPALCIAVAHFDLPLDATGVVAAVCRGLAVTGLALLGMAPAALVLTATVESPVTAAVVTALGLALGGALGLRQVVRGLGSERRAYLVVFIPFVVLLATRTWWLTLPMLGRGVVGGVAP